MREATVEATAAIKEAGAANATPEVKKKSARTVAKLTANVDAADVQATKEGDLGLKQETAAFSLQVGDIPKATTRAEEAVVLAEKTENPALVMSALKTRALAYAAGGDNARANADALAVLKVNPKDEDAQRIELLTGRHVKEKRLDMLAAGRPTRELETLLTSVRESAPTRAQEATAQATRPEGFGASVDYSKQASNALKLGDWQEVHRRATLALNQLPRNPKARLERATASIKLGEFDEAVADATAGLADKPNSPALLSVRAAAQNEAGRPKKALADASSALEINPKHAFSWLQKGLAREKLGEPDDQYLADFKTAAELDPDLEEEYASALSRRKEHSRAAREEAAGGALPGEISKKAAVRLGGGVLALGLLVLLAVVFGRARRPAPAALFQGPGSIVGGTFKLGRLIGQGGMGQVYEAWDANLERAVAIKRLSETLRGDAQEAQALIREAKTVAALKHPNIVAIYDAFLENEEAYLVFELMKGETLYDHVQRMGGRLEPGAALEILKPVCAALDYAHERRIVHRDLKPTNVMLEDGHVKVMDFGIARVVKSEGLLTMTSRVVGTPPFMAPEQELGEVSRESDLYALAICAYHMLSGKLPFDGPGAHALKLSGRFTPLRERLPDAPAAVDAVFAKALAPQRADRYRSGAELYAALSGALGRAAFSS